MTLASKEQRPTRDAGSLERGADYGGRVEYNEHSTGLTALRIIGREFGINCLVG